MKRFFTKIKLGKCLFFVFLFFSSILFAQSPGDIIITEVGPGKFGACSEPNSEWWEIYNTTASDIDLTGWIIDEDGGSNSAIISAGDALGGDVIIEAGTFYTFGYQQSCVGTNYVYGPCFGCCGGDCSNMSLNDCGDGVEIRSPGGTLISYFLWDYDGAGYTCNPPDFISFIANNIPDAIANGGKIEAGNVNYGPSGAGNTPTPGGVTAGQVLLPVELISFSANNKENYIQLSWQTASEINNLGFDIERSQDGKTWETLNFVAGHGNTNQTINYEYEDHRPLYGSNYYRLKQMDFDGQFEYSKVVLVEMNKGTANISIYPNPVNHDLTIKLTEEQATAGQLFVYDYSGKQILQLSVNLEKGTNILPVTTANLQSGIYFMQLTYDNQVSEIVKFVKK